MNGTKVIKNLLAVAAFLLCLVVLSLVVLSYFVKDETGTPIWKANRCINHLRQLDAAANQFALEHHLTNGSPINYPVDLTPYILDLEKGGKIPPCPSGGTYHISKVGEIPTCSLGTTVTPAHVLP
jgi:hypothetical protein